MNAAVQSHPPLQTIKGRVSRLFFSGVGLTTGFLESNGDTVRFAGAFAVAVDDQVEFQGHFENSKYGMQFKALKYRPDLKLDEDGLVRFLAASKKFFGIGATRAREIVALFGQDFDRIVVDEPLRLTEVRGVTEDIAMGVREEWLRRRQQAKAITFLAAFGLTPYQVDKLLDAFGDAAVQTVQENPYVLMEKVDGFGFRRADDVAMKTGVARSNPHRVRAGLLYAMKKAVENGNTCLPKAEFLRQALELLVLDGDDAHTLVEMALNALENEEELVTFEGADHEQQVALHHLHRMEKLIATVFQKWGGGHGQ